jgi:prolyl-tRNA synthetase
MSSGKRAIMPPGAWRWPRGRCESTRPGGYTPPFMTSTGTSTSNADMHSAIDSLTRRRGAVHRWSRTLIPTAKEAPADADAPSHRLLVRAGFVRRVGAGIYDYLPLAWRTLTKISDIVRQEMDGAGASEMLMPAMEPIELLQQTGRDEAYGDNLFRVTDRHGRVVALAPTHEEIITELMKSAVSSYRQLPLGLYQIQTKFRDEFRPRSGLLRCREFIMKDAYTFHMTVEGAGGLNEAYDAMHRAYVNVFTRCGLDFSVVEAESGPIGGSASHEFMVNCATGEDTILVCPQTGYAANVEKCETGARPHDFGGEPTGELTLVETPGVTTIEDLSHSLKVKPANILKCVVFQVAAINRGLSDAALEMNRRNRESGTSDLLMPKQPPDPLFVIAVVRGDHDVNESKVRTAFGGDLEMAEAYFADRFGGLALGFVGPNAVVENWRKGSERVVVIVDPDAAVGMDLEKEKPKFWVAGANQVDQHVKHFNWQRELGDFLSDSSRVKVADIRNARAGDPSPKAAGVALTEQRGIEVGHIFKLGTKYSDAMGFQVLDETQQRQTVIMGCYGIGVSRTMAACVEMSHDEHGIVWPAPIAPYHIHIVPMGVEPGGDLMTTALRVAADLAEAGLDVLIDDRDERPGVKFKDADLIGCPVRVTVGDKALAAGGVEFKRRSDAGKGEVVALDEIVQWCVEAVTR